MALSVPLSRPTLRVGGGSAFFVRRHLVKPLFPQTLNRLEYFVRLLLFLAGAVILCLSARPFEAAIPVWLDVLSVCILFAIRFMCLDIPRCRSICWSPWLVSLLVIPIVNLVIQLLLLFVPAQTPNNSLQATAAAPASCD